MAVYHLTAVIEKDEHGYYAYCPGIQGCSTQGETYEKSLANLHDAARLCIEDMLANGDEIPSAELS